MPIIQRLTTCLWFDSEAEEAANFCTSIFNRIIAGTGATRSGSPESIAIGTFQSSTSRNPVMFMRRPLPGHVISPAFSISGPAGNRSTRTPPGIVHSCSRRGSRFHPVSRLAMDSNSSTEAATVRPRSRVPSHFSK